MTLAAMPSARVRTAVTAKPGAAHLANGERHVLPYTSHPRPPPLVPAPLFHLLAATEFTLRHPRRLLVRMPTALKLRRQLVQVMRQLTLQVSLHSIPGERHWSSSLRFQHQRDRAGIALPLRFLFPQTFPP